MIMLLKAAALTMMALAGHLGVATAECIAEPTHFKTKCFGASGNCQVNFDDTKLNGGDNAKIDKITQIKVFTGFLNIAQRDLVKKLEITYRMKEGQDKKRTHGSGGDLRLTYTLGEGEFLKSVNMHQGKFVDWVQLCRVTDGGNDTCSDKIGQNTDRDRNAFLSGSRGVIHSFFGEKGNAIDALGATIERNRIFRVEKGEPTFSETKLPTVEDFDFESPTAEVTADALDITSGTQTATATIKETITTTETTTITEGQTFEASVSISQSVGLDVEVFSAGVTNTFSVGGSYTTQQTDGTAKSFSEELDLELQVVAAPGFKVTGTLFYKEVFYELEFTGEVTCFYTFDPTKANQGELEKGTIIGSQPFNQVFTKFSEEDKNGPIPVSPPSNGPPVSAPSTGAPSSLRTRPPVSAPSTDSSPSCFSGDSTVNVQGKGIIRMDELSIGDSVRAADGSYSKVHSFGHYDANAKSDYKYLQIATTGTTKDKPLKISMDHMLYTGNNKIVPARSLKVGDAVISSEEGAIFVTSIKEVTSRGAYAPLTIAGNIAVNGIVASSYVSTAWMPDSAVPGALMHYLQHGATSGHRIFCSLPANAACPKKETYHDATGLSPQVQFWYEQEQWLLDLSSLPRAFLLLLVAPAALVVVTVGVVAAHGCTWNVLLSILVAVWGFHALTVKKASGTKDEKEDVKK